MIKMVVHHSRPNRFFPRNCGRSTSTRTRRKTIPHILRYYYHSIQTFVIIYDIFVHNNFHYNIIYSHNRQYFNLLNTTTLYYIILYYIISYLIILSYFYLIYIFYLKVWWDEANKLLMEENDPVPGKPKFRFTRSVESKQQCLY